MSLPISRRHLLGLLTGLLTPITRAGSGPSHGNPTVPGYSTFVPSPPTASPSALIPDPDFTDPSALETWKRLPMLPRLSFNDLATTVHTDEERFHGRLILGHIENQTDFEFRYLGGRNPGNSRRVLPILLFSKIELSRPATDLHMIYLLAFCHTRQQTRTFRLDRISSS